MGGEAVHSRGPGVPALRPEASLRPRAGHDRAVVLACGAAAALPVLVAGARLVAAGFVPMNDRADAVARAYDVFTSWTPLVGPWSSTSTSVGEQTHHLGPLLYWMLAVPTRLGWDAAFPLTMALVNAACVA